ncbi:MAG: zinc ribbon domain-containing protein [Chloroflexi bacterium]|nr:zinc ribbon domain-containing protein [Chloroflexota bacterium]
MPVYEYQCRKCKAKFDLRQNAPEGDGEAKCPRCGGEGKRVYSFFSSGGGSSRPYCPPARPT